jgi:hypothetical protein
MELKRLMAAAQYTKLDAFNRTSMELKPDYDVSWQDDEQGF